MEIEHRRKTKLHGWIAVTVGCAFVVALTVFLLCVVQVGILGIVFILFGTAIFLPIFLWDAIRHLQQEGEFRSWLTAEQLGQEVPFQDMGGNFEIALEDISSLLRREPDNSEGRLHYLVKTRDGKAHELCLFYGNPVDRYFARIQELRPDLELTIERY